MRLFIGIGFHNETKDGLTKVQESIASVADRGNFTSRDNLHLTLVFLGETNRHLVPDLEEVLNQLQFRAFSLVLDKIGVFEKRGGDVVWAGLQSSIPLQALQQELTYSLIRRGIQVDQLDFIPHVTLGRRLRWKEPQAWKDRVHLEGDITAHADTLSLYHSHRVDGKLTYEPIFSIRGREG